MNVSNSTDKDVRYRVVIKRSDPDAVLLSQTAQSLVESIRAECPPDSLVPAAAESFIEALLEVLHKVATGTLNT